MQLCDYWESSKYGAVQCRELAGGCQGANGNNCYPYGLWSSSLSSTDYYTNRELGNGSFENMNVRHIILCLWCALCPGFDLCFYKRKFQDTDGLQLCDNWESSKYGAARCANLNGGCQGASDTHCRPNTLWLYNLRSTGNYEHAWLNNGTLNTLNGADTAFTHAYSVRCVLDSTYVLLENKERF